MTGIYKISNIIDDRIYIGSAYDFTRRIRRHKSELKHNKHYNIKLQRFVNKYGLDTLIFELILECSKEDLLINEQFYLDTFINLSKDFNLCKKVDGRHGLKNREETNLKISNSLKGHSFSDETKRKISNALKGVPLDKNRIAKKFVKIDQYDLNGTFIKTWPSIKEASNTLNIAHANISGNLRNKSKTVKGFVFKYHM